MFVVAMAAEPSPVYILRYWAPLTLMLCRRLLQSCTIRTLIRLPVESRTTMTLPRVAVILSLAIAPTCALAEGPVSERQPAPVAIYMSFDGEHSVRAVEAMKHEVQALTKASGL